MSPKGYGISFEDDENVLRLTAVMIAELHACKKNTLNE